MVGLIFQPQFLKNLTELIPSKMKNLNYWKIFKVIIISLFSIIILLFAIISIFLLGDFGKNKPNKSQLKKEILLKACYEGTQSQSIINFRADSTFDMNITAAFGYNKWWQGRWHQKSDTIRLFYDKEIEEIMEETFKRTDNELIPFPKKHNRVFSIGPCKHQN